MYKRTTAEELTMLETILSRSEKFVLRAKKSEMYTYIINPKKLSRKEKKVLFGEVYLVGLMAFIQTPSRQMEKDIYDHLFKEDYLYLTFSEAKKWRGTQQTERRVIAFMSFRTIRYQLIRKIFYLSGICVDPSYQGRGIGSALMQAAFARHKGEIMTLRTQNPVMKQSFDKALGKSSFPNSKPTSAGAKNVGEFLAKKLKTKTYNRDTLTCKSVYGCPLYGQRVRSKNSGTYNTKFGEMSWDGGDAIFCISM